MATQGTKQTTIERLAARMRRGQRLTESQYLALADAGYDVPLFRNTRWRGPVCPTLPCGGCGHPNCGYCA